MTKEEIDILWQKAMQESIKDGEMFTRYHFPKLVAEKALAEHAMQEVQKLGQEIEQKIGCVNHECDQCKAQPEQEPVAWIDADGNVSDNNDHKCFPIPLYTSPPQRTWVNPQDEEIKILWIQYRAALPRYLCFAKALLARAMEKNT